MSERNLIEFFRTVAGRADLLDAFKTRSKSEVIEAAGLLGYPFSEDEFDTLIWGAEERLAGKRGEAFAGTFSLWDTMWGQYYLEYLVLDLVPSLEEAGIETVSSRT